MRDFNLPSCAAKQSLSPMVGRYVAPALVLLMMCLTKCPAAPTSCLPTAPRPWESGSLQSWAPAPWFFAQRKVCPSPRSVEQWRVQVAARAGACHWCAGAGSDEGCDPQPTAARGFATGSLKAVAAKLWVNLPCSLLMAVWYVACLCAVDFPRAVWQVMSISAPTLWRCSSCCSQLWCYRVASPTPTPESVPVPVSTTPAPEQARVAEPVQYLPWQPLARCQWCYQCRVHLLGTRWNDRRATRCSFGPNPD